MLIDQLPPDSHCAMRSQTEPDGADGAEAPLSFEEDESSELRSELRLAVLELERFSDFFSLFCSVLGASAAGSGAGFGFSLVPLATTLVTGSVTTSSETTSD